MGKIRVVLTDDSGLVRSLLRGFLEAEPDIDVVGEAGNGREAVELVLRLKPDLVTMDLEMPVMSGLEAIEEIMCSRAVPILVVSSVADAQNACEAVNRGALEVMGKPEWDSDAAGEFVAKVRLLAGVSVITHLRPRRTPLSLEVPLFHACDPTKETPGGDFRRLVAIASSTGGPQALARLLPQLPRDYPCPVLVAQHISDGFASGMAEWLGTLCKLPVRLAEEGEYVCPSTIYISPSERHLAASADRRLTLLPRSGMDVYRPSCDALLNSVADVYGRRAIGVILTGMGSDGAGGLARIREKGGTTLAQNEESSVIYGMNRVAIEAGAAQKVLSMDGIAAELLFLANGVA